MLKSDIMVGVVCKCLETKDLWKIVIKEYNKNCNITFVSAQPLGLVEMVIVSENLGYLNYATRTVCNDCY